MSAVDDWDTWWDHASDEERDEFLDGCVDLPDAEPTRGTANVPVMPWWAADIGARDPRRAGQPAA